MTPPGWYPDHAKPGLLRYWDGQRWTVHTRPAYPVPTAALPPQAMRAKVPAWQTWWVIVPGLLLCLPVGLVALWRRPGLSTNVRWIVTGCTAAFLVFAFALPQDPPPKDESSAGDTPVREVDSTPDVTAVPDEPTTSAPAPAQVPDLTGMSRDDARIPSRISASSSARSPASRRAERPAPSCGRPRRRAARPVRARRSTSSWRRPSRRFSTSRGFVRGGRCSSSRRRDSSSRSRPR
ncbi:DUF2510 domain-containing protein [Nocardioides ginsengisoli]|uniref:DUF2510 domain-containing protein n=1 Tax=Nocardioides ginsengisoli TaxID=363868 RepID=A0ABW3VZF7_9ACTN